MGENAEVRIKLVADDGTASTMANVKEGLKHVGEDADKAGHALRKATSGGMFGFDALAAAAKGAGIETSGLEKAAGLLTNPYVLAGGAVVGMGFALMEAAGFAKDMAEEAIKCAAAEDEQVKAMSGVLLLMDEGKHSMEELRTYAYGVHDSLELAGLSMGVGSDKMDDAFNKIVQGGAIGTEHAKELTEQMAMLGRVTRGGIGALAEGFAGLERGQASQRNGIVKLIAATHTLEGNAKQVAKQMSKMTPTKQLELGEKAISKMAEQLKKGGTMLDLGELATTLGGIKEEFFESMGHPLLDRLLPPLNRIKDYLLEHIDSISAYGEKVGYEFARVIDWVSAAGQGVWTGIIQSWDHVQASFNSIFGDWMKAWDFSMGTTDEISATFARFTDDLTLAFELGAKILKASVEVFNDARDVAAGRDVGTTNAKALGAAATYDTENSFSSKGQTEFDDALAKYRSAAKDVANTDMAAVDAWIVGEREKHALIAETGDRAQQSMASGHFERFGDFVQDSIGHHRDGQTKFALAMLHGSAQAEEALTVAASHMAGGMKEMMNIVGRLDPELAKELKKNPIAPTGLKPPHVTQDFRGSQFHIKQDFRDQDPDRVALVFRRDIMRNAVARTGAVTGNNLGL